MTDAVLDMIFDWDGLADSVVGPLVIAAAERRHVQGGTDFEASAQRIAGCSVAEEKNALAYARQVAVSTRASSTPTDSGAVLQLIGGTVLGAVMLDAVVADLICDIVDFVVVAYSLLLV